VTAAGDAGDAVSGVLENAIAQGRTPGAVGLAFTLGGWRLSRSAGALHRQARALPVDEDTVFDLASLTKLLSTTMLAARAVDAGLIDLSERPWPAWPGVSVEHVLRHESGLPGWRPLFERTKASGAAGLPEGRAIVLEACLSTAPETEPGSRTTYSDLGFIALGALLEERLGAPLDQAFAEAARATWGETGLRFVRLHVDGYHPAVPRVAPTERCPWRRRVVHGQVHDENCFAMGGVAGHAGLFGSMKDVEQAARALLEIVRRGEGALGRFAAIPDGPTPGRRPLGFDCTTPGGSTGDALGPRTVGHLAFTGCSLWLDPDAGAGYVLLTNRIHESREHPEKIRGLRQAFHREAARCVRGELT
jgi:serine-type D-Ala-D-Ala carboxypeptidase